MSTNFDPKSLDNLAGSPKKSPATPAPSVKPERLFMRVERYETPGDNFHFAVGTRLDTGEAVRVRLNSLDETVADRPHADAAKIREQYVSGSVKRPTIAEQSKNEVVLLSFDDARLLKAENGVSEYRAHWPKPLSLSKDAEAIVGLGTIALRAAGEDAFGKPQLAKSHVELIVGQTALTKDNADKALGDALAIKDEKGQAREPFAVVRIVYEGKIYTAPRIYPALEAAKVFDQNTGQHKEVKRLAPAAITLAGLADGKTAKNDLEHRSFDYIRAAVAGVKGEPEPAFHSKDETFVKAARNIFYGAQSGELQVELLAVQKIDFGKASSVNYLKDATERKLQHLTAFNFDKPIGADLSKTKPVQLYGPVILGIERHKDDGKPFVVFASPLDMRPKNLVEFDAIPLVNAPKPALTAEAETTHEEEHEEEAVPAP